MEFLFANLIDIILTSRFPKQLKYAHVKPVFTKGSHNDKINYIPVSIFSNISKIYERLSYKQLETHCEYILSPYQFGFIKGFIVLTNLFPMIEKWRENFDSGGNF